jgi:hypothetical protein
VCADAAARCPPRLASLDERDEHGRLLREPAIDDAAFGVLERRGRLEKAIEHLSVEQRFLISAHYFAGQQYQEHAGRHGEDDPSSRETTVERTDVGMWKIVTRDWLDEALRDRAAMSAPAGFTRSVMAQLPSAAPSSAPPRWLTTAGEAGLLAAILSAALLLNLPGLVAQAPAPYLMAALALVMSGLWVATNSEVLD